MKHMGILKDSIQEEIGDYMLFDVDGRNGYGCDPIFVIRVDTES
jgi:hypothetical protein